MYTSRPTRRLGELLEKIVGGGTPSKSNPDYWDGQIPWASVKDVKEGESILESTEDFITEAGLKNSAANLIPTGTLIISTRMGLGRVVRTKIDTAINQDLKALFPKKELDPDYLLLFLRSKAKELIEKGTGATVSGIKLEKLKEIEIPVPPIEEQRKIVAKIEMQFAKLDEAARLRAESLALTDQLLPAALHEIFSAGKQKGWEEKELGDLCDVLDNKRKPVTRRDRKPGQYPYYGATQVQDYVADYIFDEPLVLLGEDGARWGASEASAYKIEGKTWVNNHAHVLRPRRDQLLDSWLVYSLNHADLSEYITGTTVKKLNQEKMRSIKIPLPPLAEQKAVVKKLDALSARARALRALQTQQVADLKALKQSILHEAFGRGSIGL